MVECGAIIHVAGAPSRPIPCLCERRAGAPPLSWWLPGEHWLGTTGCAIAIARDGDVMLHIMPGRVVAAASALHALCAMLSTASVV